MAGPNPAARLDNGDAPLISTLKQAITDLHDRLRLAEDDVGALKAGQSSVVDGLVNQITNQFSALFTDADQVVQAIRAGDFLSATTATPVSFAIGADVTMLLDAGTFPFEPSGVVHLVRTSTTDDYAFGRVLNWTPSTRALTVEIFAAVGEVGPHPDVRVEVGAVASLIMQAMLAAAEDLSDQVAADKDIVAGHRADVVAAAALLAAAAEAIQEGPVIAVNGKAGAVSLRAHEILLQDASNSIEEALEGKADSGAMAAALAGKAPQATTYTKDETDALIAAIGVMTGATSDDPGVAGLVPAPAANDHLKFFRGDGTWVQIPSGEYVTELSTTTAGAGTWTAPIDGYYRARVYGAGGGGVTANASVLPGGAGGGFAEIVFYAEADEEFSYSVGAGGAPGQAGGTTTFGGLVSATGGSSSTTATTNANIAGGLGVGGTLNRTGGSSVTNTSTGARGGGGGAGPEADGGEASNNSGTPGAGGGGLAGDGGQGGAAAGNGSNGYAAGGGGGSGANINTEGSGANGALTIERMV